MKLKHILACLMLAAALPTVASAQTFSCITNNSGDCNADSGAQSYLGWSMQGNELTVYNKALQGNTSFIGQIYFSGSGAENTSISGQSTGVAFQAGATPESLPGVKSFSSMSSTSWSAIQQGANHDGVDAGEWISFLIPQSGQSALASTPFQFGLHLQSIGEQGFSESLVATVSPVPEPETYALLMAGLGLIGAVVRRRKQTQRSV